MYRSILSDVASYASVISLLLTAYIVWSLRNIRNKYIFRARAPEFAVALSKLASTLIEFGNDFENSKQAIGVELAKSDVKLKHMQNRMPRASKKAVKQLRVLIAEYERYPDDKEKFYLVYREINRVAEEVREVQEDLNLE